MLLRGPSMFVVGLQSALLISSESTLSLPRVPSHSFRSVVVPPGQTNVLCVPFICSPFCVGNTLLFIKNLIGLGKKILKTGLSKR